MRIIVEGCGSWAMQYFTALRKLAGRDVGVIFTYDSTFGLDVQAERLSARLYSDYLNATLRNVEMIQQAGFACVDVKDTLFKLRREANTCRRRLPSRVDAVFVVTPDSTHCDVAEYWLGKARWVFVEKPFDRSRGRVAHFCETLASQGATVVYATDHYFVRCNQAAVHNDYFLDRLLPNPGDDITSFEFCMTEPPSTDSRGNYDPGPMRERALSLQAGMVFDMGAHAVPVLLPFIDLTQGLQVTEAWAGVSEPLRNVLFSGAESFSIARVQGITQQTRHKPARPITGTFTIGKDIDDHPEKYLLLEGPGGKVRFDLLRYHVYHEGPDGQVRPMAPLQQDWAQFFVSEVVERRIPRAVEMFEPPGALRVVDFLEQWRGHCQNGRGAVNPLAVHAAGAKASALKIPAYRVL